MSNQDPIVPTTDRFEWSLPSVSRPMLLIVMGWFIGGLTILVGLMLGFHVSPAMNAGPNYVEAGFAIMLMAGSSAISFSGLKWKNKSANWMLELFGWPVLLFAWLIYVTTAMLLPNPVVFPTILGVFYFAASAYRLTEVLHSIKVTTRQVAAKQKMDSTHEQ